MKELNSLGLLHAGCFYDFCSLLTFLKKIKNCFRNTIRVPNSLYPDQTGHVVTQA